MTSPSEPSATVNRPVHADLSRLRHELRTPINHILGYCEMLMEEALLPAAAAQDLKRIHAGGRELQSLISRYFEEEQFQKPLDLHQLYHDLRTPVNHIVGYSDLLLEQCEDQKCADAVPDLLKIREAAATWLALMEAYLIEPVLAGVASGESDSPPQLGLNIGLGFRLPEPQSATETFTDHGCILIVDDDESSREMLARRLRRVGYTVSAVSGGIQALALARRQLFDLILLDMIMPGLDGFQVLAKFKADAALRDIPVIMLSALDDENGIARSIEMGAEDYLAKPFNPVFLRARIGACLQRKRLQDQQRRTHQALVDSQARLAAELAEAAVYVRSLFPQPLSGNVQSEWCFEPSQQLGGDAFGHHWVDADHLAIYLLDVCGHGIGAALLSVSALNAIRAQALSGIDFGNPAAVLTGLNRAFPMDNHNNLFFSLWYGVYELSTRTIIYSSGGHPPALLLTPGLKKSFTPVPLRTEAPALGCIEEADFTNAIHDVPPQSQLLVFSDGVFEIFGEHDRVGTWQEFLASFNSPEVQRLSPSERLARAQSIRGAQHLEDDFSLLQVRFP